MIISLVAMAAAWEYLNIPDNFWTVVIYFSFMFISVASFIEKVEKDAIS
jgi:hypothetical protein